MAGYAAAAITIARKVDKRGQAVQEDSNARLRTIMVITILVVVFGIYLASLFIIRGLGSIDEHLINIDNSLTTTTTRP